ncbi:MAG TPA: alpha/beta hydrolase [Acidimicrobiales bacterium]|nr:alpha/beta hydrolase [Acidimicrobiales bacterium]
MPAADPARVGGDAEGRQDELPDPEGPAWFRRALASPVEVGAVFVDGARIAFRRWGERGNPGVVLVHGGGAHSRWWDHVAPMLAGECGVAALDLSGHGDSDRRETYSFAKWASEILAVAEQATGPEAPVVVAHSMGGFAALKAAVEYGDMMKGVVVIDSPVREPSPEEEIADARLAFGPLRLYPSAREALARFHLVPDQPSSLPYVMRHVALTSLRQVQGGWTWKFDPAFSSHREDPLKPEALARVSCRVALLRAEFGLVTPDIGTFMYERLGRNTPVVEIPLAYHHVMLDQPLSLVTAIRTLLADWRHSSAAPPDRA